jgi:hypothetical protein
MQDITIKVVRETVVERQIPGYTKTEIDGQLAALLQKIEGRPTPQYPAGALFVGNLPLTINQQIVSV